VGTTVQAEGQMLRFIKEGVMTAAVMQKRKLFTYQGVKALFDAVHSPIRFTPDDRRAGITPIPANYSTGTFVITRGQRRFLFEMKPLRFAIFGAGFWANYQLPAWLELPGVECVAIYNRHWRKQKNWPSGLALPAFTMTLKN
jgi:ABC-type sugar transport system substrate-binding protein